mgnify:CR=1 FL=1
MPLDDPSTAFSESSQDGSNSIVSQGLFVDTNDSNMTNGQSAMTTADNSPHIVSDSVVGADENSSDAQFPDTVKSMEF